MKLENSPRTRSFLKPRAKQVTTETDIESSCGKLSPVEFQSTKKKVIRKKSQIRKSAKKQVFHERIYRFKIRNTKKTMRIYLYKESDMGWPKKYTKQLCPQEIDNDIESDSQIVQNQIEKCKKYLFQAIQQRAQSQDNDQGSN